MLTKMVEKWVSVVQYGRTFPFLQTDNFKAQEYEKVLLKKKFVMLHWK